MRPKKNVESPFALTIIVVLLYLMIQSASNCDATSEDSNTPEGSVIWRAVSNTINTVFFERWPSDEPVWAQSLRGIAWKPIESLRSLLWIWEPETEARKELLEQWLQGSETWKPLSEVESTLMPSLGFYDDKSRATRLEEIRTVYASTMSAKQPAEWGGPDPGLAQGHEMICRYGFPMISSLQEDRFLNRDPAARRQYYEELPKSHEAGEEFDVEGLNILALLWVAEPDMQNRLIIQGRICDSIRSPRLPMCSHSSSCYAGCQLTRTVMLPFSEAERERRMAAIPPLPPIKVVGHSSAAIPKASAVPSDATNQEREKGSVGSISNDATGASTAESAKPAPFSKDGRALLAIGLLVIVSVAVVLLIRYFLRKSGK